MGKLAGEGLARLWSFSKFTTSPSKLSLHMVHCNIYILYGQYSGKLWRRKYSDILLLSSIGKSIFCR